MKALSALSRMGLERKRRWLGTLLILLAGLGAWQLHAAGAFDALERLTHDQRMQWLRGEAVAPDEIAVILVDESSLAALNPVVGRWPWPRELWADLLTFLEMGEPDAVAFDILFSEDEERGTESSGEIAFAREAMRLGRVVQAKQLLEPGHSDEEASPFPPGVVERFRVEVEGDENPPGYRSFGLPVAPLRESARRLGVVTAIPESDGIHRRLRLLHPYDGNHYPGLSVATLQVADRLPGRFQKVEGAFEWPEGRLPVDDNGRTLINPYAEFDVYSVGGVFRSLQRIRRGELAELPVRPEEFKGRMVFIGASAVGLHDVKATSLSSRTPGVFLHAALAGNVVADELLAPAPDASTHAAVFGAALLAGLGALLTGSVLLRAGLPLLVIGGWTLWVLEQQVRAGIFWEWAPVVAAALITWLVSLVYLGVTEGRDRRRVRRLLGQYVSPAVLREVADQKEGVATGEVGTSEEMTILFSDVRGFTSLSEQFEAAEVVELLNILLGAMTEEIFRHQGTLDKFIGDAIMAFWGAPIRVDNHAEQAVYAAVAMERRLVEVNREVAAMGGPELRIGIGLHTGEVILGNIGSDKKLDYTIIGDNVNVASRMEGLTKPYGCVILLSGECRTALPDGIICGLVDRLRVKGRRRPLDIYRPLALPEDEAGRRAEAERIAEVSARAYRRHAARDWRGAMDALSELPEGDPVREHLMRRNSEYRDNPPPDDWDGAHTMESK